MTPLRPFSHVVVALALALPTQGCCTMARFFCGPDDSEWISESFETHAKAVSTLREAIRRDARGAIYRSLSPGFKAANGLSGALEVDLMWSQLQEQFSGVHLLGYADVSEPEVIDSNHVTYHLSTAGYVFEVRVVRLPYAEILWDVDGEAFETGAYQRLRDSISFEFDDLDGSTRAQLEPLLAEGEVNAANFQRATVGYCWKIDGFDQVGDEGQDPEEPASRP